VPNRLAGRGNLTEGWRKRIIGCSRRVFRQSISQVLSWLAVNSLFPATRELLLVCLASFLGLVISLHVDRLGLGLGLLVN